MKFVLFALIQCFAVCSMAQNQNLNAYKKYFDHELSEWTLSYVNFKLSEFILDETKPFDNNNPQDLNSLKSFYSIYKPILTFSKDSNRFVDIYSYQLNLEKKGNGFLANVDIDQAIYLYDKKAKYWDRIYFSSSSNWIVDVTWVSYTKFILVCSLETEKNERAPRIILGDAANKTLRIYRNTNKTCIQKPGRYRSPKLKKLSIEGL